MIVVTVLYENDSSDDFNMDYYLNTHMPLVKEQLGQYGCTKYEVLSGISDANPAEPAIYSVIASLYFDTVEHVHEGFKATGRAVMGDIPNFTNVKPKFQISEATEVWLSDDYVHSNNH